MTERIRTFVSESEATELRVVYEPFHTDELSCLYERDDLLA